MGKDFDHWNEKKKHLNEPREPVYFRDGEVWWVHLGLNIGFEIDGKDDNFARPVIVLRKYNKYSFLALPLTTSPKANRWKLHIGQISGKQAWAVLSQLRNIDSRRLYQKIATVSQEQLAQIKKEARRMNFDEPIFLISPRLRAGEPFGHLCKQ